MHIKENVILIDFPKIANWEFKETLNENTNLKWKELEEVSNKIRKNKFSNIGRYLKYFAFPFKIFLNRKKYENIIAWQQYYGLLYAFYSRLFHTKKYNKLIIMTFIYKPKNGLIGKIYNKFMNYTVKSKYIDKFICFSKNECEYYSKIFNMPKEKFEFCILGIEKIKTKSKEEIKEKRIIACGRSNRDYDFLYNALKETNYKLDIISDECKLENCSNITIYNNVDINKYLEMLEKSYITVISLKDEKISSGQLVILQAMQLGKPIICTKTDTVTEYIQNGENGFIINKDKNELLEKIEVLYNNKEIYKQISTNQKIVFEEKYSQKALAKQIAKIWKK